MAAAAGPDRGKHVLLGDRDIAQIRTDVPDGAGGVKRVTGPAVRDEEVAAVDLRLAERLVRIGRFGRSARRAALLDSLRVIATAAAGGERAESRDGEAGGGGTKGGPHVRGSTR